MSACQKRTGSACLIRNGKLRRDPEDTSNNEREGIEQLLRRAMSGDQVAVDILLSACLSQLRGTAARFFRNHEDVEDVVQESLLSAYRNFGQYQGRAKFSTWLHRIAINEALMEIRRRKIRTMISLGEASPDQGGFSSAIPLSDPEPSPEARYSRKEEHQLLNETLERLPASFRSALRAYYFQELSTNESAVTLGITRSNFKSRLCHARRALLKRLRQADLRRRTRTARSEN
jgi:RNA polymerase sigma-70 factor, ECF subfamily